LVLASLLYFKLARTFKIVDLPNHRTMHEGATVRGGGIVILFGMIVFALLFHNPGYYFLIGLGLLGITGFLDDLIDLSGKVRFSIQAISVVLILLQLGLIDVPLIWLIVIVVIATGILNAFNFMDGINGMTAGYSLVFVSTLIYFNYFVQSFIEVEFLYGYFLSILVFSFFNFRNKAVCFAGDVGSLTIAFINVYLLLKLMDATQNIVFIFLFALYGIDTVFTIVQRMFRKENIFEAHRLHLFQVTVSNTGISHLTMTSIYMLVQIMVNMAILFMLSYPVIIQGSILLGVFSLLSASYIWIKFKLLAKNP
jgi:UDP-N-acetylmuramyl pentapeptide phosphotransferase/UDP-N-acetylglucosamine-1-phosphate transferase